MTLKRALRRGRVLHLHSKVGRTEYMYAQTATSVAHILNVSNIPWSQNIEALKIFICISCAKLKKKPNYRLGGYCATPRLKSYFVDKVELPHQIPKESVSEQLYTKVLPCTCQK